MKKCPYCAEEIQDEAIVCRWCGRDLVENVEEIARARTEKPKSDTDDAEEVEEQEEYLPTQLRETPASQEIDEPTYALNPRKKVKKESAQETDAPASPLNPHPRTHKEEGKERTSAVLIAMPIGLLLAFFVSISTAADKINLLEKYGAGAFRPIINDMIGHFITNFVIWTLIVVFLIFIFRKISD